MTFDLERQELEDEYDARMYGDPRRCSVHGLATSSNDGMFDAPCPACECDMEYEDARYREEEEEARRAALSPEARAAEDAERVAAQELRDAEDAQRMADYEIECKGMPF